MANIDLTELLQALIGLLAALITCWLIPYLKAKATKERQGLVDAAINTLVYAAEQLFGAGAGREKLEYVKKALRDRGFTVDDARIEAAVYELLNKLKTDKAA